MHDDFHYDVFLSHSSKDKAVVRHLAKRLRADGLKVWFDEWVIKPGDLIPAKIEEGLEHSRVLVLCMSAQAFGSDWPQLESNTFRFRDPLNKERRFLPLRLDNAPLKVSLAHFLCINWLPEDREQEYAKLLEACRAPIVATAPAATHGREHHSEKAIQLDTKVNVSAYCFDPNDMRVLTSDPYGKLCLWDLQSGQPLGEFGYSSNAEKLSQTRLK